MDSLLIFFYIFDHFLHLIVILEINALERKDRSNVLVGKKFQKNMKRGKDCFCTIYWKLDFGETKHFEKLTKKKTLFAFVFSFFFDLRSLLLFCLISVQHTGLYLFSFLCLFSSFSFVIWSFLFSNLYSN